VPGFVNYKKGALDSQHRDKVYQLLAHGRWFSPAYSTTKAGRHDIAEILLKMALNTTNHKINHCMLDSRQWRGSYHSFTQSEQIFSYRSRTNKPRIYGVKVKVMVFTTTFNNISVILWRQFY
jgi:hypothetical protein